MLMSILPWTYTLFTSHLTAKRRKHWLSASKHHLSASAFPIGPTPCAWKATLGRTQLGMV